MRGDGPEPATVVAQTNLQLYNQLQSAGWSAHDLARVKEAYEFSMRVLGSRFRPDGKPFTAHGIGTASVLVQMGCGVEVVLAGLLHAVYAWGDWPEGSHVMTEAKRAAVRDVVGSPAERIINDYTNSPWEEAEAESVLARGDRLDTHERDMLMLKLANALDDNRDLGRRYRGESAEVIAADRIVPLTVEVARTLGMTAFADQLQAAREEELAAVVPSALAYRGGNAQVAPLTHRRRLLVWLRAEDTRFSRAMRRVTRRLPKPVRRLGAQLSRMPDSRSASL